MNSISKAPRQLTPLLLVATSFSTLACEESSDGGGSAVSQGTAGAGGSVNLPQPTAGEPSASTPPGNGGAGGRATGTAGSGLGGRDAVPINLACDAAPYAHAFEFGAIFEGWSISTYSSPSLIPMTASALTTVRTSSPISRVLDASAPRALLVDAAAGDAATPVVSLDAAAADASAGEAPSLDGAVPDPTQEPASMGTLMELDTSEGAPDSPNGALKLTIPFDGPGQLLLLANTFNTALNFQGTLVSAQIKLDSGLITSPADTARANLVLKATQSYVYFAGPAVALDPSAGWVTLTLDPDAPPSDSVANGYNACEILEIDIEIHTGASGMFQEAVVYIDQIVVTPQGRVTGRAPVFAAQGPPERLGCSPFAGRRCSDARCAGVRMQ